MSRFLTVLSFFWLLASLPLCQAASSGAATDAGKSSKMNLVGVVVFEEHPRALISMPGMDEEMLVNEGDLVDGYTVRRIDDDQVELAKGDQTEILMMNGAERLKAEPAKTYLASAPAAEQESVVKHLPAVGRMKRVLVSRSSYRAKVASNTSRGPHFIRPIAIGFVSSPFGLRHGAMGGASTNHKGVDIAAPHGSPIYAAADGVVVESAWSYSKGNYIVIRHDSNYETAYFHMSKRMVETGKTVQAGDRIGSEGNTGISFGPHLHFEVHYNGVPVNPSDYVRSLSQR